VRSRYLRSCSSTATRPCSWNLFSPRSAARAEQHRAQLTLREHRREHHEGVAGDPGKQAAECVERNTRHIRILTEPLSGELDVGVDPDVLTERRFHGAREPLDLLGLIGVASPELALDGVQQMPELVNREIDASPRRFEPRIGHDHRNGRTQDATASTEIHRAICLLMLWSLSRLVRDGARPQGPSPPGQAITEEGRRGRGPSGRSRTAASLTSTFLPGPAAESARLQWRRGDHRLHGRWGALGGRAAMPLRVERYLEAVWSSRCSSSWAASSIALCRHSAAR